MTDRRAETMIVRHRARALQAIAHERCVTDLTDGFCGPRDGKCQRARADEPNTANCCRQAEAILRAMETSGIQPVWIYDPEMG
jgi:hypothetical protein